MQGGKEEREHMHAQRGEGGKGALMRKRRARGKGAHMRKRGEGGKGAHICAKGGEEGGNQSAEGRSTDTCAEILAAKTN